jgi:hypothetical protein
LEAKTQRTFDSIPTLDKLHALGGGGYIADIILIDLEKIKKVIHVKGTSPTWVYEFSHSLQQHLQRLI